MKMKIRSWASTWGPTTILPSPLYPWRVLARVRSQLRRYTLLGGQAPEKPSVLTIGGICLDDEAKTVTVDGEPANLTPMEFSILRLLMSNPGRFIPPGRSTKRYGTRRPWAAREPWRYTSATFGRKIEINPSEPRYLKVVWGQGYKMEGENPDV